MSLFTTSVSSISARVSKITNVFTKTVNDLKKVNEEISVEIETRDKEASRLLEEAKTLDTLRVQNSNTINKITEFLG